MKKLLLLFALLAGFTACSTKPTNYTVIISLDGSRWDYADYYDMPFFDSLATVGVKARMEPSFPSSTFPNHYTMATGLVPDHHGLVNNSFWDPETDGDYAISSKDARFDPHYYGGEPIWITANAASYTGWARTLPSAQRGMNTLLTGATGTRNPTGTSMSA